MLELKDFQPFEYANLVRRGSTNDGGYLVPSDITAQLLISLGLGDDWKFELDLVKHNQVDDFIVFDHSVTLTNLFKKMIKRYKNLKPFVFRILVCTRYFRDFVVLKKQHIKKKITKNGSSENFEEISLSEIFKEFVFDSKRKVILKIDIEGSEFDIIEQVTEFSNQIMLLIIEFHEILMNQDKVKIYLELLNSKFLLIHTHANNFGEINNFGLPNVCEFTFLNKNVHTENRKVSKLPLVELDAPCNSGRPDIEMLFT